MRGQNSLRSDILSQEAAVAQQPRPQLDSHDAKDEKDKEAEEKDISQHGQGVQQQRHQDPHAFKVQRQKRVKNLLGRYLRPECALISHVEDGPAPACDAARH